MQSRYDLILAFISIFWSIFWNSIITALWVKLFGKVEYHSGIYSLSRSERF